MQLHRSSWLYWWAYLPERIFEDGVGSTTSVCQLFWRAIFGVPMIIMIMIILSPVIGTGYLIFNFFDYISRRQAPNKEPSIIYRYIKAKKDKICPIVHIID